MNIKYYNLYIDFSPSWTTYHAVSGILAVLPSKHEKTKFDKSDEPSIWHYQVIEEESDAPYSFIDEFINLLKPNFHALEALGIKRSDILFWLVYEYEYQCALGFMPEEMMKLGEHGISLNIDCHRKK